MKVKKIATLKTIVSLVLVFNLVLGIFPVRHSQTFAATFEDINQSAVFQKQAKGSVTCTLVSASMLVRRAAMMNGSSNWGSISESTMESTAWIDGAGLRNSFTYAGITVNCGYYYGDTTTLINLLSQHPEGIVIYNTSIPHAILITDYTNGTFYCADPSPYYPSGRIPVSQASFQPTSGSKYWYVSSPDVNLSAPANNPIGYVDSIDGGIGTVAVWGWAFDYDEINTSLEIHVYIGGSAATPNAESHRIIANKTRTDVNAVYNTGSTHGYLETIQTNKRGNQDVYIYAINVGATGQSIELGHATVYIDNEKNAPVITNANVTDISPLGYTVTAEVSDDTGVSKIQFPTWTSANDQDDLAYDWGANPACSGTLNNGIVTFDVKNSAHNNETGEYHTHIYAYDIYGNVSCHELPALTIPTVEEGAQDLGNDFYAEIIHSDSGQLLTTSLSDSKGSTSQNSKLYMNEKSDSLNQLWHFVKNSDGISYRILSGTSEFALDVLGSNSAVGNQVWIYPFESERLQAWYIINNGGGYSLLPKFDTYQALNVTGNSHDVGADIQLYSAEYKDLASIFTIKQTNAPSSSHPVSNSSMLGDADKDGKLTLNDVQLILKVALNIIPEPTDINLDSNKDGKITLADVQLLLRVVLKITIITE